MKNIIESDYKPIPTQYSNDIKEILKKLLEKDPNKRPNIKDLLSLEVTLKHKSSSKGLKDLRDDKKHLKIDIENEDDDSTCEFNDSAPKINIIHKLNIAKSPYNQNNPHSNSVHHQNAYSHVY